MDQQRQGAGRPPEIDDLAVDLRYAIMRTTRRLRSEGGLGPVTQSQHSVLTSLRDGPSTMRELAEREGVQAPWMTRTIAALVENNLVQRSAAANDRRQAIVSLTAEGQRVLVETRERRTEWLAAWLADLDGGDREVLKKAAGILMRLND